MSQLSWSAGVTNEEKIKAVSEAKYRLKSFCYAPREESKHFQAATLRYIKQIHGHGTAYYGGREIVVGPNDPDPIFDDLFPDEYAWWLDIMAEERVAEEARKRDAENGKADEKENEAEDNEEDKDGVPMRRSRLERVSKPRQAAEDGEKSSYQKARSFQRQSCLKNKKTTQLSLEASTTRSTRNTHPGTSTKTQKISGGIKKAISKKKKLPISLNKRVYTAIDTKQLVHNIKNQLKQHGLSQTPFATTVLGVSQGTFSDLLSYPKSWKDLGVTGKIPFVRMHNWLQLPDDAKVKMVKAYVPSQRTAPKSTRFVFLESVRDALDSVFQKKKYLDTAEKETLAKKFNLTVYQVNNFFQNSRNRAKMGI